MTLNINVNSTAEASFLFSLNLTHFLTVTLNTFKIKTYPVYLSLNLKMYFGI